jgi:serine/threonine-protein kinase HipA
MNLVEINHCPCTLAEGYNTFSPAALRLLFNRKKPSHILDCDPPGVDEDIAEKFRLNSTAISISGAQFKQSLVFDNNNLRLTQPGEQGHFILKPVPFRPPFGKANELPANEHLTMQIARQVFNINTAACTLVFFKNGEAAYLTKRFDYSPNGEKIAQEDFASISGLSKQKNGSSFLYHGSYEDLFGLMKTYVAAYAVEVGKLFERIVFNYLFSNGDAHLKNFSLHQTPYGDYILSPAYDLLNTSIHIPGDSFFALNDGLFSNDYYTKSFQALGFYAYDDFYEFGLLTGQPEVRVKKVLNKFRTPNTKVVALANQSFLSPPIRELYLFHYHERLKMLNTSFSGKL